ncbi:hypothetical protein LguiA_002291 [Lonicera macranthoides]
MMLLYPGFTLTFVTFLLLIPSHSTDFVHTILPSVVLLILTTLCFIIPPNISFLRRSISGKKFTSPADQLCRRFTFSEIRAATRNFSSEFVIGKGGFGKVFKGIIDNGATTVAIKRLDPMSNQGGKEFSTEIEMLSKFRHSHIVSLIGYCDNKDEMILVYEYVENGSLADNLYKGKVRNGSNSNMSWVKRVKICIGAARGIDYLHTGTGILHRVIHRDVKSSNILLDENWAAKVSDFGLSKIGPANQSVTHVSTRVKGTQGYCDPEYFLTRRLTRKSDVYSFGVVLFEVLCGRPVFDYKLPEEQISLVVWAKRCMQEDKTHLLIDPNLKWEVFENSLKAFVKIAGQCLLIGSKKRPTMSEVVASLEVALSLQENRDSSLLDEYIFDFGETYDPQEAVGSSSIHSENVYTDSSTALVPLSHSPPTGPIEGIEKPSLGKDTPEGSASESLFEIKGNMTCEEQINDNILVSEVVSSLVVAPALQEKKDYSVLDDDVCNFHETFDSREMEGSSTVLSDIAYTDSSSSIVLNGLPPSSPIRQSERIEKTSLAKNTSKEDTLGGPASETLSNITANMIYDEQINENILHAPTVADRTASFALEEKGPGIEGVRINGDAKLGGELIACPYPKCETSLCTFQVKKYSTHIYTKFISGATNPEYIVTADDVDTIIAIECVAMDHKEHLGKPFRVMANNGKRITCEPDMQQEIDRYISEGLATFDVLFLVDSHGGVVPTTLVSEKSRYPFMIYTQQAFQNFRSPATEISKIFCDVTSIQIPLGRSADFVLRCSDGSSHSFKTGGKDTLRGPTSLLGSTPAHMQSMNSDILEPSKEVHVFSSTLFFYDIVLFILTQGRYTWSFCY